MKEFQSKKLFKNNLMEKFTRVHPSVAITYNLICSMSMLYINFHFGLVTHLGKVIGLFALGFASWTLAEYLLHRYFFHLTIEDHPFLGKISRIVHGVHHDQPTDYKRMFMPPVPATLFMLIFLGAFYVFMRGNVFVYLPGFLMGYLSYAFVHFKIHQSKPPKNLKWLWTHHLKHHYQDDTKAYGVSSPFWDIIFKTLPSKVAIRVAKEIEGEESAHVKKEDHDN